MDKYILMASKLEYPLLPVPPTKFLHAMYSSTEVLNLWVKLIWEVK